MCVRYRLTSSPAQVQALLGTANEELFPPRETIAPTQPVLIARLDHLRTRKLELVRWGLIPGWAKDPSTLPLLINVKCEDALDKPTYRAGMRYRRCLVPADGYYVWTGSKGQRQRHTVVPAASGPVAFAGIWDHWLGADGSEMESMAILTLAAGPDVAALDVRMPAIVAPADFAAWLDCRETKDTEALGLLRPSPAGTLRIAGGG